MSALWECDGQTRGKARRRRGQRFLGLLPIPRESWDTSVLAQNS